MDIKPYRQELKTAYKILKQFQSGEQVPIKTRFEHFNKNSLGGIYNGNIITIAAPSGVGKSYTLQLLERDMFDPELNPLCDDYVLLRCNWEMSPFKLLMRAIKNKTHMKSTDILFNKPDEELEKLMNEVYLEEGHPNVYSSSIPTDANSFFKKVSEFLDEHEDNISVGVTVDHHALVKDSGNKKKAMDDLVEAMNALRMIYPNVFFILLSQFNREIEKRTNVKELSPNRGDLYNTDTLFQISDVVIGLMNPRLMGHKKYMHIAPEMFPHLTKYMINPDNQGTNFNTDGLLFWHYMKIREPDDKVDISKTLFIEEL